MKTDKFTKLLILFIILQPLYDIFIYFLNNVINFDLPFISFVRPLISIGIYLYLLFSYKISTKEKLISFIYLSIYGIYCILHLINIRNNFFELSYGNMFNEIRYLCNYGYFIIQLINFYFIFKIVNKEDRKKILISFTLAIGLMTLMYFISIITNTSPLTYIFSKGKEGWRGWSVSAHYIGHSIIYALPVIIYTIFEKKYINKWYKYLFFTCILIPPFYLVGTKTPLFMTLFIVLFYTLMKIIVSIKDKKISKDTIYFITISLVLISTFNLTYGYANFKNQISISEGDETGDINLIEDNIDDYEDSTMQENPDLSTFENRMVYTLYKYRDIKSSVFDNRTIQKTLNKYLYSISPIKDKIFGYGHDTMPNCNWVETDILTIFYCYGLVGFLLIIVLPLGYIAINGLKCLFNIKKMSISKFILGFGFGLSLAILYFVGYTMQFAQTVFYLIILLIIANDLFIKITNKKIKRDYLFMINDLSIGGAEVGMVDVVNELSKNGNKVDIVLLRKRGPLLEKLDKNINVYEILNSDYNKIKKKIYHIFYMIGGPFIKYVYKKTIKADYNTEVAYLEGYPSVFIASSNNKNSTKIASIRVGLKNHKLKAHKIPWGERLVKNSYKKMDYIYTVSDLTTQEFLEKYPFCEGKTSTIYTYFNVDDIVKKAKEKIDYKFDQNMINFLAVGRFNTQKGYDRLIEAFSKVVQKNPNVLLHFLGKYDTEEGKKVIDLIEKNNIKDEVILHGIKSNPYPYMKQCDCLISSSLYEGYPRVINEALCLKKICIGTNVTGTKEALKNGKMGLLVDDSISGLEKGMLDFINDKNIYDKYKEEIEKFDGNKESYFKGLEKISNKKKKMIIYMPKLSFGGMEKALVNLINYAKLNEKYDLTLYLVYKGDMNYLELLPKNIKIIIACPNKWNLFGKVISFIKLIFRYIYQIFVKYDIAISYSYQHPILTSLTRLSSENSIVYIHSNLIDGMDKKLLQKRIKKCKYEKFKKIICVSEDSKKSLIELIHRKNNIYVLNNVIDGDKILLLSNEKIDDFAFDNGTIYFVNICRHFENHKRLLRIIDATKRLNIEGYKFEVIFIGDGEDHQLYVDKIKELNIKNIHLLGKKQNPYKYLKNSSCLLLSSIREGYPVVFVESLVLNIPIVTTNVSDAKKDIKNKYGIVVSNNDEAIYDGMKKFINEGFKIKYNFDYIQYNQKIYYETIKIYEE